MQVLLDVGAGMGFYTTAAAAAGRKVEAMEAGHWSLVTLQASVAYNGFAREVNVQQVGAQAHWHGDRLASLCSLQRNPHPYPALRGCAGLHRAWAQLCYHAMISCLAECDHMCL